MERRAAQVLSAVGATSLLGWLFRRRGRCCDASVGAWPGPASWSASGRLEDAADVNSFVDDERPCWRHLPVDFSLAILGIDPGGDAPTDPPLLERTPGAGSGEVDVRLQYDHEGDDSVAATRYRFTFVDGAFTGGSARHFRLIEGVREFRCQPGRGHEDWGPDLCL